ncbi:hypothetical protein ACIG63_42560 [Streptomyces antimycoticus]
MIMVQAASRSSSRKGLGDVFQWTVVLTVLGLAVSGARGHVSQP